MKKTNDLMDRLEMLVVCAETYAAHEVDVPGAAINLIDVIGPMLVENLRKAKGWTNLETMQALTKQRAKVYKECGVSQPDPTVLEQLLDALAEITKEAKKDKK